MIRFYKLIQTLCVTLVVVPMVSFAVPDGERYIVQFKQGHGKAGQAALKSAKANVDLDLAAHNAVAARIPARALKGLQHNPNIEFIEIDEKRYPLSTQFEPYAPYGISMVQADVVAEANPVAADKKVLCIIDSGIDMSHPEFSGNANISGTSDSGTGNWFTDEHGHGTHVAGTIAAAANGAGVVGVNPAGFLNVQIIKVFNAYGWAYSSGLVAALDACEGAGD